MCLAEEIRIIFQKLGEVAGPLNVVEWFWMLSGEPEDGIPDLTLVLFEGLRSSVIEGCLHQTQAGLWRGVSLPQRGT